MLNPSSKVVAINKYLQIAVFVSVILYFGKTLFIPLFFGLLVAIVMYPVCLWLEKRKWPRSLAITVCLLIVSVLFAGLLVLLIWQINVLQKDLPVLVQKFKDLLPGFQLWLSDNFGFSLEEQKSWMQSASANTGDAVMRTLRQTVNTLFILFLIPVFAALFLFHRGTFVKSLRLYIGEKYRPKLDKILTETIYTYFNFIKGMILVYIIVGLLNTAGLLALGIKHAFLFGMLCAVMTIIPYIGIIVSSLLPISVAWITTGSVIYPLAVVAIFGFVQYLEANVIFPRVVGTQINVSTWATLVAILAGGILWGVAGMILFIPFLAILKIITDNLDGAESLKLLLSRK